MNKQAKYGRFEAQQHLEAEIRAKQRAQEELRQARTRCDELERQLDVMRRKLEKQRDEYERVMDENTTLKQQHWAMRHWPQRVEALSQGPTIGEMVEQGAFQQHHFNTGVFNNSLSGVSSAVSIPSTIPSNTRKLNHNVYTFYVCIVSGSCLVDDSDGQLVQSKIPTM